MNIQSVSGETGKHTAVIVPMEEWNRLKPDEQEFKVEGEYQKVNPVKPSDFRETISSVQRMNY